MSEGSNCNRKDVGCILGIFKLKFDFDLSLVWKLNDENRTLNIFPILFQFSDDTWDHHGAQQFKDDNTVYNKADPIYKEVDYKTGNQHGR